MSTNQTEIAKQNFRDDVRRCKKANLGGVEYKGEIYTEWENLPESARDVYEDEAQTVGRIKSRNYD